RIDLPLLQGGMLSGQESFTVVADETQLASGSEPYGCVEDPGTHYIWFAEQGRNKISRVLTDGTIEEFEVPPALHGYAYPYTSSQPVDVTMGADGRVWFTEYGAGKVGRVRNPGAPASEVVLEDFELNATVAPYG